MNAIFYQLELLEPVLATMPQSGEENSATAYDFIPGSMVRGALIAAYARQAGIDHLMADENARSLFFDDKVMFLNAYPFQASSGTRMLPTPFSWRVQKRDAEEEPLPIWDWAVAADSRLEQPEALDKTFVTATDEQECFLYTPARQVNVHNASTNRNQKGASSSTVFRYDALAAGEWFAGAIVSENAHALETLLKLMPAELSIGGSHTAGYGRVAVRKKESETDWHEVEMTNNGARVVITLLSDAIVRGAAGKNCDFDGALKYTLGLAETPTPFAVFQKVRVVGGFNRKAGLPLAQEWAVQAGSVFVYAADALRGAKSLETLAVHGIGERRSEGLGRVALNWQRREKREGQTLNSFSLRLDQLARAPTTDLTMSEESKVFAKQMATRQLRAQLERELARLINRAELKNPPTNAQLGRVRVAAQRAWSQVNESGAEDGLPAVREVLKEMKGARSQFQAARIGGERFEDWLGRMAALEENAFRREFGLGAELPKVAQQEAALDARLRAEFTARWIDGVMKKAALQTRGGAGKEGA